MSHAVVVPPWWYIRPTAVGQMSLHGGKIVPPRWDYNQLCCKDNNN